MARCHKGEPFFLFLHFYDPHDPYEPPEPFASRWRDDPYSGEVAFADHCVGQVLEKLRGAGSTTDPDRDHGDHGEMLGEHGELNHGFFIYEGALRVPLMVRVPGLRRRGESIIPSSLIDIVPTILSRLAPGPQASRAWTSRPGLPGAAARRRRDRSMRRP